MTEPSGKTGQVTLGVWFDEEAGDIHVSIPGQGLRDLGKPHPAIIEEWSRGAAS